MDPKEAPLRGYIPESHGTEKGVSRHVELVVLAVCVAAFDDICNRHQQAREADGNGSEENSLCLMLHTMQKSVRVRSYKWS